MRWPRFLRPVWSLAALGLALSLLAVPMAARADDDDDDSGTAKRQGTVRIYGGNDDAQGGYLGVQVQDVTRALQRARNLPTEEGALVNRVEDESPADRAGIRRGDVITEVDRDKIDSSQDLIRVVGGLEPGSRVRVTLWRSGSVRTVNVQLGERPHGMMGMPGMPNMRIPDNDDQPMRPPSMSDRDVQRQIRELRDQLQELRQEIQSLRRELRSNGRNDRDDDNDRSRKNDDEDDD